MSNVAKVGLFAAAVLVVLAFLVFRIEDLNLFRPALQTVDARFDTVTGLDDKASVRVAGVRVGRVDGISLDGQRARVRMVLQRPIELTEGAYATIANVGLLGEKYVELFLGRADARPLPAGTVLEGTVPPSFDQAMAKLSEIGDSILGITRGISGESGGGALGSLLDNLDGMSAELRGLVAANRAQVESSVRSVESFTATLARELPRIAESMNRTISQIETVISENRDSFGKGLENIRELTERFKVAADNINEITTTLASGEGSIGKLLKSDDAHDSLVSTLNNLDEGVGELRETLGRVERLKLDLGFEGYYLEGLGESRTAFHVNLDPQNKRFYLLEAVDDPRGRFRRQTETITTRFDDGHIETDVIESEKIEDKIAISAQLGFQFGQVAFRGGLIESTGGAGVDWTGASRRFGLSLEAFDFSRKEADLDLSPRLRLVGRWNAHPNVYLIGGYDDLLESRRGSAFLGIGLRWSDDDLKYLMGSLPTRF